MSCISQEHIWAHQCHHASNFLGCSIINLQIISRTNELLESANEQKRKQEEALGERQQQIVKLEAAVKSISGEVFKV